ncbi:MAG: HlyD family efflux transporter periplasmic adaptor subunit [Pseudomonadota bacterium]
MRFIRRSLVGLFLLSLTVALLSVAGSVVYSSLQDRWAKEERVRPARERVFSVNVIEIQPDTISPVLATFGEVASRRTLDLRAPLGGTLVELAAQFEEGAEVRQGQLLARIDPADAQTSVDVARTDLDEANADFSEAQRALSLAEDELVAAQDQAELRDRALDRQNDLKSRGVGTEAAVETAELAASSARQSVLSRRQAVQQAEARVTQIATLIERRSINLANAQRLLADTEIHADFSGRLTDVAVSAGGLVANNERLATLVDPSALEVSFRVSTSQFARLLGPEGELIDAPVTVTLDVLGTALTTSARLVRDSASVSEGTTGRLLFANIGDPKGMRPGDFVNVQVTEPELSRVVQVPATAVDGRGTVLVLGDENRLTLADVQVLRRQGDDTVIRARGLAGREIVAERSPLLGEGIRVNPLRPGAESQDQGPEMVLLDDDRRAKIIAFVESNQRIPNDVKSRMLAQLAEPEVPAQMVARIESRMGS